MDLVMGIQMEMVSLWIKNGLWDYCNLWFMYGI